MMNAEATAENRPAFSLISMCPWELYMGSAHKDQGRVQIFIIFLEEFLVVLLSHCMVVFVEFGPMVLLTSGRCVLFLAARRP